MAHEVDRSITANTAKIFFIICFIVKLIVNFFSVFYIRIFLYRIYHSEDMKGRRYSDEWQNLGEKLRRAREEAGLSQYEVAEIINRCQSYLSKLEKGFVRLDLVQLKEFCDLYEKTIDYFL